MRCLFLLVFFPFLLNGQCENLLAELDTTKNEARIKEIYKIIAVEHFGGSVCELAVFERFKAAPKEPKIMDLMLRMISNSLTGSDNKKIFNWGLPAWKALKNQKDIDSKLAMLTNNISNGYINVDKLDSALYFTHLCEDFYSKGSDQEVLWRPNFNKYRIYLALKNYKKADYYLNKSYSYVKDSPNRMNKGFVLHSVLVALKARGDQKVFEKYLKEYILFKKQGKGLSDMRHLGMDDYFTNQEEAKQTLERIVQTMIKDSISAERVSYRSMVLSELYEEDNEFAKAEQLYLKMLNLKPTAQEKKNLYINLYRMYKKKGDQQKAYKAIENYIAVQDSSFQQIFDGKIADYEVKYQTQEKERELLKKDLELTKSKNRQRSLIGLAFFLTTLGGVGYYIYRRKLKHQREMVEKDALIQKQRIADLEQKNKLLALNSMIEGQESERLRIAQDLHDGLGGLLTTVKAHFNAIEREIANIKEMNIYEKTNQLIDEACVEVRRIAHDMVPYSLKMNGLEGVLADIRQTVLGKGIHCDVDIHNVKEEVLGEQKVVMIYRIIQEVVNNALKHSGASHMLIQLVGHESGLNVMIEDNGKGFDVNQLLQGKGLGLKSIESRVKYLEGNLNIDSTPNQGTTINIEIPLYPINTD